jgi:hypothetical protein
MCCYLRDKLYQNTQNKEDMTVTICRILDRSAEDAYSSKAPDPTFTFVGGLCCPTLEFVIAFWLQLRFTHC